MGSGEVLHLLSRIARHVFNAVYHPFQPLEDEVIDSTSFTDGRERCSIPIINKVGIPNIEPFNWVTDAKEALVFSSNSSEQVSKCVSGDKLRLICLCHTLFILLNRSRILLFRKFPDSFSGLAVYSIRSSKDVAFVRRPIFAVSSDPIGRVSDVGNLFVEEHLALVLEAVKQNLQESLPIAKEDAIARS